MRDFRGDFCFRTLVIIHTEKRRVQIKRHNLKEGEILSELLYSYLSLQYDYVCGYTSSFGKKPVPDVRNSIHKLIRV